MSKHEFKSDDLYNAGLPDFTQEQIREIYAKAGVDIETGRIIESDTPKTTSGKTALASGKLSAGALAFDAPTWAFIAAAKSCGCLSCAGVLENIKSAAAWNKSNLVLKRPTDLSGYNTRYFIHRLREIVMSRTIKHNV